MFGETQADKYLQALFRRFDEIVENPHHYPVVDHIREGYRRSVCGVDSIYFTVELDGIAIMRVLGKQAASAHLGRSMGK